MAFPASNQALDQIVKGAPPPNTNVHDVAASAYANPPPYSAHQPASTAHHDRLASLKTPRVPYPPSDPTSLLPSSPPQIYLNLLILEASLRSQYLTLRARKRQNTFVLTLLAIWIAFFFYLLWLRPREDGKGIGGSKYWLVDSFQKMCFITGLVTALLFWATGQWERGMRWPRRWISVANRGLRGTNAKIVVIRGSWAHEVAGWLAFMLPFSGGLWGGETGGSSYHFVNLSQEKRSDLSEGFPRHRIVEDGKEYAEEDIAPGGDLIKLILLPKPFTPDFREGWEIYRAEYWGRENERRGELRRRIRARQREVARAEGGWLWWTGWRGWKRAKGATGRSSDIHHPHHQRSHSHQLSASNSFKERKRRPSVLRGREGSYSRSSSRSTTPTPDMEDRLASHSRERRWSNSTTGSTASYTSSRPTRGAKKPSFNLGSGPASAALARQPSSRLSSSSSRPESNSRPGTPNESLPWQSKRASTLSTTESARDYEADASGFEESNIGSMGPPPRPQAVRRGSGERGSGNVFPNAPSA
ncbi:Nem1-Spo7 phosphatase regulatory subunit [Didymosphaeria variabile]|uniref:Nem1-Spo7 phosphatase regulatory subunit n=1 Tax=Didymosphaeria variabile TaxID=1932322 RepID=A0A9W9CB89_9PLEO|nr:Nem1-Spo7 phosphatase regulatory subunit [Didymosphaeria variabile]KAJ4353469.1 Nem1-Spo7 phosphatase regulatory subunit [Didymosphaeria variabile]